MYSNNEEQQAPIILQQRRLRNVRSIYIRNLTINFLDFRGLQPNNSSTDPFLFFTLHQSSQNEQKSKENNILENVVFTSEKVGFCPNPTWSSISIPNLFSTSITEFTLRLWLGIGDSSIPALHWNITLQHLFNIGETLHSDKIAFHSNAVVVGLHGSFYTSSVTTSIDSNSSLLLAAMQNDIRFSYKPLSMRRILSQQLEISNSRTQINLTQQKITSISEHNHSTSLLQIDLENLQHKVGNLRRLLKREKSLLSNKRDELIKRKVNLQEQETELLQKKEKLENDRCQQNESYTSYMKLRDKLIKLGSQLGHRRREVLSELSEMFPIVEIQKVKSTRSKKTGNQKEKLFSICSMPLPNSESFNSRNDGQTSTALGYASQLLSMMSIYLLVPLRYPLVLKGSVSSIVDNVTEKLSDKERIFPLHVKGNKDRFLFEYGVFLLNKNVAQLRYYCGQGTSDLRPTLENIKSLLDNRLGAKATQSHPTDPIAITKIRTLKLGSTTNNEQVKDKEKQSLLNPSQVKILETKVSPYKRIEHRNNELSSLRGQLFGSATSKKVREHSPSKNPEEVEDVKLSKSPIISNYKPNIDSVETLNFSSPRKQLTGLEEIGQTGKSKLSLASARAELMGKKASTGSSFLRYRQSSDSSFKNRSELFKKSNGERSGSNTSSDFDVQNKTNTFSSNNSEDSDQKLKENSKSSFSNTDDLVFIDSENHFDNIDKENYQEKLPYMNAINGRPKNASFSEDVDPLVVVSSEKNSTNQIIPNEEEFDFC